MLPIAPSLKGLHFASKIIGNPPPPLFGYLISPSIEMNLHVQEHMNTGLHNYELFVYTHLHFLFLLPLLSCNVDLFLLYI